MHRYTPTVWRQRRHQWAYQFVVNGQVLASGIACSRAAAWTLIQRYRRNLRRYGSPYGSAYDGHSPMRDRCYRAMKRNVV